MDPLAFPGGGRGVHHGLQVRGQFRRVNGHLHLPKLLAALEAHFTENVSPVSQNEDQKVA